MHQCLARADVGIAMGALGSDAAIEAADVVLMDDKPSKIALAIELSCRTISLQRKTHGSPSVLKLQSFFLPPLEWQAWD